MNRRHVLTSAGTLIAASAGCLGRDLPASPSATTEGTQPPSVPFDPQVCPSFDELADRTVCYHATDSEATDLYVEPSMQEFLVTTDDDTVESLTFTLQNETDHVFGLNPYDWEVMRWTEDGWEHVAPDAVPEPWLLLRPGQTFAWSLSLTPHPSPDVDRTRYLTLDLDPGVYAFSVSGRLESKPAELIECVALFTLELVEK